MTARYKSLKLSSCRQLKPTQGHQSGFELRENNNVCKILNYNSLTTKPSNCVGNKLRCILVE